MLIILVFCAITLSEMSSDIYVPGLPYIQEVFNASKSLTNLTISLNLLGIAVSGLFYGILSDCYGRKKLFLTGFMIFTISSFFCCFTQDIYFLILMRFFQGVGAGVSSVVGHASIKDVYSGTLYAQIVSKLSMVISLSPAIAPIVGGFILSKFDWQFLFVVIFIMTLILLIMLFFFFKETLAYKDREVFQVSELLHSYSIMFSNRSFLIMIGIQASSFMWLWNEIANLPFLFISKMGVKVEHYGYFVAINVFSYILGTIINQKYISKAGIRKMLLIGILCTIFPDIFLLIICSFITLSPVLITLVWVPSMIGLALIVSNSIAIALSSVNKNTIARASACLSFTQMGAGALVIYIIGFLFESVNSIFLISITNTSCSILALIIYALGYKNKH